MGSANGSWIRPVRLSTLSPPVTLSADRDETRRDGSYQDDRIDRSGLFASRRNILVNKGRKRWAIQSMIQSSRNKVQFNPGQEEEMDEY